MHRSFIPPAVHRGVTKRSRGYLPHWEIDRGVYFITFRLDDSLPGEVVERLAAEKRALAASISDAQGKLTTVDKSELARSYATRMDQALDRGYGSCCLKSAEAAEVIRQTLEIHDKVLYELCA